jgi:hypothetical protein
MSNVLLVTGALFTWVRHVDNILTDVDVRLAAVDALVDDLDAHLRTVDARIAGKLDAVDTKLTTLDYNTKLTTLDFQVQTLNYKLNTVMGLLEDQKKSIDEQKKCNNRWFAVVLVIGVCIFWTMYTKTHGLCVPTVNVHVVEPVEDRSIVSTIADELFAWLFVRPWYE